MWYSSPKKGYKLYNLADKSFFFVSRDVSFKEDIFPFKSAQSQVNTQCHISGDIPVCDPFILVATDDEVVDHVATYRLTLVAIDPITPIPATSSPPNTGHIDHVEGSPDATPVTTATEVTPYPIPVEFHRTPDHATEASTSTRKSTRRTKTPGWLSDIVHKAPKHNINASTITAYLISAYKSYGSLSESCLKAFCNLSCVKEPKYFEEAVQDPKWLEAMRHELQAFNDNQTWQLVDLPPNKKAIVCIWVF